MIPGPKAMAFQILSLRTDWPRHEEHQNGPCKLGMGPAIVQHMCDTTQETAPLPKHACVLPVHCACLNCGLQFLQIQTSARLLMEKRFGEWPTY